MISILKDFLCLNKKFLVLNLISRNLKIKYRRSFFGYLWSLLVPVAQAAIYFLVFSVFLKVKTENYLSYVFSGVLLWGFFSNTISFGMDGLVSNRFLLTKIPIPIQVFPIVETATNLISLILALPVLLVLLAASGIGLGSSAITFIYIMFCVAAVAYGLSVTLAVCVLVFPDLKHIFMLLVQLWMYATPVLYDVAMIPNNWKWILFINPIGTSFVGMHSALIYRTSFSPTYALVSFLWALASLAIGIVTVRLAKRRGLVELL